MFSENHCWGAQNQHSSCPSYPSWESVVVVDQPGKLGRILHPPGCPPVWQQCWQTAEQSLILLNKPELFGCLSWCLIRINQPNVISRWAWRKAAVGWGEGIIWIPNRDFYLPFLFRKYSSCLEQPCSAKAWNIIGMTVFPNICRKKVQGTARMLLFSLSSRKRR